MVATNEMFELLVKITGDSSGVKNTLAELKNDAKQLSDQLQKAELGSAAFEETKTKLTAVQRAIKEFSSDIKTLPPAPAVVAGSLEAIALELNTVNTELKKLHVGSDEFKVMSGRAADLKLQLKDIHQPIDKFSASNKTAQNTAMNVNRVIQDMPYGLMGVANNVDALMESWGRLRAQNNSVKTTFQALLGAMTGPTGVMMAVSAGMALFIAFGDKIVKAMSDGGDAVDGLRDRVKDIHEYKDIGITIAIHGSSGLKKLQLEMEQLITQKNYLEGLSSRRKALSDAEPSLGEKIIGGLGGDLGTGAAYAKQQALKTRYAAEDRKFALDIWNGKQSLGEGDVAFMTRHLKEVNVDAIKEQKRRNDIMLKQALNTLDQEKETTQKAEEVAKGSGLAGKNAAATETHLQETLKRLQEKVDKENEAVIEAQETLYSSMISDTAKLVLKNQDDLDKALKQLHSGVLGDRYDALMLELDNKIAGGVEEKVRDELKVLQKKLKNGVPLTKDNVDFLQKLGGMSKTDSGFLGEFSKGEGELKNQAKDGFKKGNNPTTPTTFKALSAEYEKSLDNLGPKLEGKATEAFGSSVDLFSAQLAQAIFSGGQSFTDVLGDVAKQFGVSLMQFVIQAFAQRAADAALKFLFFAEGTPASPPGYAWVGEKGPELVRMRGGEEVVPTNQVHTRLNNLYAASSSAQSAQSGMDISGLVRATEKQTKALIKDRLNYEITMNGVNQIARATKARDAQISRYTGLR